MQAIDLRLRRGLAGPYGRRRPVHTAGRRRAGNFLLRQLRRRVKFCGECGQRLGEPSKPSAGPDPRTYTPKHLAERLQTKQTAMEARGARDGERKTITALFADIKGSVDQIWRGYFSSKIHSG